MSECNTISKLVKREGIQDIRREIPAYADPVYRLPSKPTEIPLQVLHGKLKDLDTDALKHDINMDFEKNPHIKKA